MSTIDKIKNEAAEVAAKLNRGESVSKSELKVLEIYNSLAAPRAFNSGIRKNTNKTQRIK